MIIGIFSITIYFCFIWVFILFNLRIFISCHTNFLFIYLLLLLLGYIHYILIFSFYLFFLIKKTLLYTLPINRLLKIYTLYFYLFFSSLYFIPSIFFSTLSRSLFSPLPSCFFFFCDCSYDCHCHRSFWLEVYISSLEHSKTSFENH